MHSPLFILKDILLPGSYLLGVYAWGEAMRMDSAVLRGLPPLAGAVTLSLEINGQITNKAFVLEAGAPEERRLTLALGVKVPAGQTVRWRVTDFAGAPEDAASQVSVTLNVNREADTITVSPEMSVWWVNGQEQFKLFRYDPATATYTSLNPALSAPRAVITQGAEFSIAIQGGEVLRVADDTLFTASIAAGSGVMIRQASLRFYVGTTPVATLTADGLLVVPAVAQLVPVDQTGQFLLGDGAALNMAGLIATGMEQPL